MTKSNLHASENEINYIATKIQIELSQLHHLATVPHYELNGFKITTVGIKQDKNSLIRAVYHHKLYGQTLNDETFQRVRQECVDEIEKELNAMPDLDRQMERLLSEQNIKETVENRRNKISHLLTCLRTDCNLGMEALAILSKKFNTNFLLVDMEKKRLIFVPTFAKTGMIDGISTERSITCLVHYTKPVEAGTVTAETIADYFDLVEIIEQL